MYSVNKFIVFQVHCFAFSFAQFHELYVRPFLHPPQMSSAILPPAHQLPRFGFIHGFTERTLSLIHQTLNEVVEHYHP